MLSGLRVDPRGTLAKDVVLNAIDGGAGLEFGGIGANLTQTPEGIAVSAVGAGDPAERAGLRAGDRILGIDGESTDGMSLADAIQRLRGEAGTSVGVSVRRPKTSETVDVDDRARRDRALSAAQSSSGPMSSPERTKNASP